MIRVQKYITSICLAWLVQNIGMYKGRVNMWIEKIENSKGTRYKYQERFTNPVTGKNIKLSVTLNRNTKQAQKIALEMLQDKFNQKFITAQEKLDAKIQALTFYDVADEWLEYSKPTVKLITHNQHATYVRYIQRYIDSELLFIDFTVSIAEKLLQDLYYTKGLCYGYCASVKGVIKNIMRYAKKSKYVDDITDFDAIKIKRRPMTASELEKKYNKFLNKDELKDCLSQLNNINPRLALAMEFIALTGLRCGELLALRVQDYDKAKSCISVNGTIRAVGRERTTPKNMYSYRSVFLNERAKQILDKFILQNKRFAQWNSKNYKDKGYIFTSNTGNPYCISNINKNLKMIKIANKQITSHIFRHTHISMLAELGTPLKAVMQRVGHNNPNTTLKIYTHVTENMGKDLQQKIQLLSF